MPGRSNGYVVLKQEIDYWYVPPLRRVIVPPTPCCYGPDPLRKARPWSVASSEQSSVALVFVAHRSVLLGSVMA